MKKTGLSVRSYTFKVIIEEDPFEDGTMAYHTYCPALVWGLTFVL
jgi:hypothetical protein